MWTQSKNLLNMNKENKILGLKRRLYKCMDGGMQKSSFFIALVRSYLEFSIVVWSPRLIKSQSRDTWIITYLHSLYCRRTCGDMIEVY